MTDGALMINTLVECSNCAKLTPPHVRGFRFLSGGSLHNGPRRSQTCAPCKSPCKQSSARKSLTNSAPMNNALVGYGDCAELNPLLFSGFESPSGYSLEKGLQRRRKVAKSHLDMSTAFALDPVVVIVPERFATNVSVNLPVFTDTRMSFIVASRRVRMFYLELLCARLSALIPQVPILTPRAQNKSILPMIYISAGIMFSYVTVSTHLPTTWLK